MTTPAPQYPLPDMLLADIRRRRRKVSAFNNCAVTDGRSFTAEDTVHTEIQVGVIAFGTESAALQQPPYPGGQPTWTGLTSDSRRPMRGAWSPLAKRPSQDMMSATSQAWLGRQSAAEICLNEPAGFLG